VFFKILNGVVEGLGFADSPSEDGSVDGVEVGDKVGVGEVNELVDLS
jgi:hypothetical protein